MDGTPVRLFDTWLHYLPDMRLVPTEQSETDILAWDDAGTRDNEIRRILSVLQPMIRQTDSIPMIMVEISMYIPILIGLKQRKTCIIMVVQLWSGLYLKRCKMQVSKTASVKYIPNRKKI